MSPRGIIALTMLIVIAVSGLAVQWQHVVALVAAMGAPDRVYEDHELYRQHVDENLITLAAGGPLVAPASDWALAQLVEAERAGRPSPGNDPVFRRRTELVKALHGSRNGKVVLEMIKSWNASRLVVAIRDDRPIATQPLGPLQPGDNPAAWTALRGDGLAVASQRGTPSPGHFAFVAGNGELPVSMSDWRIWVGAEQVTLGSDLELTAPARITVQMIGRLDTTRLPPGATVTWRCRLQPCTQENAVAAELALALPAGRHHLDLAVHAITENGFTLPGLKLDRSKPPQWSEPKAGGGVTASDIAITTADGVALWDAVTDHPTDIALRGNYLPLLGYGKLDGRGLAGLLSQSGGGHHAAVLTIDSRLQAAAQQALSAGIEAAFPADDPYHAQRRGSLVMLDADSGAILAAARYPVAVVQAVNTWDLERMRMGNPVADRLSDLAWQGLDPYSMPGSAIKPLVVVAALRNAADNPALRAMIEGCRPDARGLLPCTGLSVTQTAYAMAGQSGAIRNFQRADGSHDTFALALRGPLRDPRCGPDTTTQVGVERAIQDSLNIYFVRLQELLDRGEALQYDTQARRRRTKDVTHDLTRSRLIETAHQFRFFEPLDLLGAARPLLAASPDAFVGEPAQSDLADLLNPDTRAGRRSGAIDAAAQSSIGQRWAVSPLHIALVMSGIASGRISIPHLISEVDGQAIASASPRSVEVPDRERLVAALKSPPETGTAHQAFNAAEMGTAKCAMHGKTGTGEMPKTTSHPILNTAWFSGFADLDDALPRLPGSASTPLFGRRIAFAVQVTHTHGAKTRTGGQVAAPIVAKVLRLLAGPPA